MSNWTKYFIKDLLRLHYGKGLKNYQHSDGEFRVFGTNGPVGTSNTYLYDKPTVILGRKGAYRSAFFSEAPTYVIDTAYYTEPLVDELSMKFMYYWFVNFDINNLNSGSAIPSTSRDEVYATSIFLPTIEEQIRIVEPLSLLDAKIDLLLQQNQTLEAIGAAVFRKWIIEGEDHWPVDSLMTQINLVGGGTPKTSVPEFWDGPIGWLSGGDIASNHKGFIASSEKSLTDLGLEGSSAKLLPANALIISARGTVGKYAMLIEPMAFSQSNYGILPADGSSFFYTYLLIDYAVAQLKSAAYGSVFDTITTRRAQFIPVPLPPVYLVRFSITISQRLDNTAPRKKYSFSTVAISQNVEVFL